EFWCDPLSFRALMLNWRFPELFDAVIGQILLFSSATSVVSRKSAPAAFEFFNVITVKVEPVSNVFVLFRKATFEDRKLSGSAVIHSAAPSLSSQNNSASAFGSGGKL